MLCIIWLMVGLIYVSLMWVIIRRLKMSSPLKANTVMDLSLAPTNDLLEELVKRHDAVFLTGIKFTRNNGEYVTFRRYSGNNFTSVGLADVLKIMISKNELSQTNAMNDNEDR